MSIAQESLSKQATIYATSKGSDREKMTEVKASEYTPESGAMEMRNEIVKKFSRAYIAQNKPRVEFNDLSLVQQADTDLMAFNVYQPNDGEWPQGDIANSWRSTALRPIERDKVVSMAGHVAGRLGFLHVEAMDGSQLPQKSAADVMDELLQYIRQSFFTAQQFHEIILASLYHPKAIVHVEWQEIYSERKTTRKKNGGWNTKKVLDDTLSGYKTTVVPPNQFFIENYFERNIQKQEWIIWRRVQSHTFLEKKYSTWKNWDKVQKAMQLVYTDPNSGFYYVYDPELWNEMGEEVIYWSKSNGGCRVVMVNGVIIGDYDEKNPREDGAYPFATFGFGVIRSDFFWDKSLVSYVRHDAEVLNSLWPLFIDGATLSTIPPTLATGTESIDSSVIIPGMTTTIRDKEATIKPIMQQPNIGAALSALREVEAGIDKSVNIEPDMIQKSGMTAYQVSLIQARQEQAIGPYRNQLLDGAAQLTKLAIGDILQHFTVVDADKITGKPELIYKTFMTNSKRISFEDMNETDELKASYDTLKSEVKTKMPLFRVNPTLFRNLKFYLLLTEDVLSVKSSDVKHMENIEMFDQAIKAKQMGVPVDLTMLFKELILAKLESTKYNVDELIINEQNMANPVSLKGGLNPLGGSKPPQAAAPKEGEAGSSTLTPEVGPDAPKSGPKPKKSLFN